MSFYDSPKNRAMWDREIAGLRPERKEREAMGFPPTKKREAAMEAPKVNPAREPINFAQLEKLAQQERNITATKTQPTVAKSALAKETPAKAAPAKAAPKL